MRYIRWFIDAVSGFIEVRRRIKTIDNNDPVVARLNAMAIRYLFESLPRVNPARISKMAKFSLGLRFAMLPIALVKSLFRWLLTGIAIIVTASVFPAAYSQYGAYLTVGIILLFFWRPLFIGLTQAIFLFIEWLSYGSLMMRLGRGYVSNATMPRKILNPWGPIFGLLGLYAETMNADDRAYYEKIMDVFWKYQSTRDLSEFDQFESMFWSTRESGPNT